VPSAVVDCPTPPHPYPELRSEYRYRNTRPRSRNNMSHHQQQAAVRSSSMSAVVGSTSSSTSTIPPPSLLRAGSSSLASSVMSSSSSLMREKPPSLLGSLASSVSSQGGGGGTTATSSIVGPSPQSSSAGASTTGSSENLPPRTLARVSRDVRDLVRNPPEGVRLVLDGETGMPGSLGEIMVSRKFGRSSRIREGSSFFFFLEFAIHVNAIRLASLSPPPFLPVSRLISTQQN
jgi:hypothetical protein